MQEEPKNTNPYYPDIPLFLGLIPIINAFNYYLTYSNIQLDSHLLLTFSIDTVQGYLAWVGIRYLILYFDDQLPYHRAPLKRIMIQLIYSQSSEIVFIVHCNQHNNKRLIYRESDSCGT
jgi:hypothetical protein